MTEAEWMNCTDPTPMLEYLCDKASHRKLRLFACASCRRIWHLFLHDDSFRSIQVGERFADGEATDEELRLANELAIWAGDDASWTSMQEAASAWAAAAPVEKNGISAARSAVFEIRTVFAENGPNAEAEGNAQSNLLRDIFGNPFRPIAVEPAFLTWNNATVCKIAQAIYFDRAFDRFPVLADALEEAGCDNPEILSHCRSPGPHVRGCWVVDILLGKE